MVEIDRDTVLAALARHIGRERGISCSDLVREIVWKAADSANKRKLRHVIEGLRREGHHLCGHPTHGYFIAASDVELNESCMFLYNRAMTSLTQISAMKRISLPDFAGQLRLKE